MVKSINEYWNTYNHFMYKASNNNHTITKTDYDYGSCYGSYMFSIGSTKRIKWTFKINKLARDSIMVIGIDESNEKWINHRSYGQQGAYSYCAFGNAYNDGNKIESYGTKWKSGDIIVMIFDGFNNSLSFNVEGSNNKGKKIKIKNNKINTFKMSVCIGFNGDSITLLSCLCQDLHDNHNQERMREDEDLQIAIKLSLEEEKRQKRKLNEDRHCQHHIQSIYDKILEENTRIKIENQELKKEIYSSKSTISSLKNKCNEFEAANNRQRSRIISLQNELQFLKEENSAFKQIINKFHDNEKEYILTIKTLKNEICDFKLKCIDELKYESWNAQEIVSWIISLDKEGLNKYKDILLINLEEEGIKGSDLININEIDLKGFGINNFKDKKFILQKINRLTQRNLYAMNQNTNMKNEGDATAYI